MMINYIQYNVWDEIAYPVPNFNGCTIKVWEWISNFTPHLLVDVITNPCWDWRSSILVKWAPCRSSSFLMLTVSGGFVDFLGNFLQPAQYQFRVLGIDRKYTFINHSWLLQLEEQTIMVQRCFPIFVKISQYILWDVIIQWRLSTCFWHQHLHITRC